ncbi:MAG: O-antigen ligase family protein [Fimbriimonadaceae bacterium]
MVAGVSGSASQATAAGALSKLWQTVWSVEALFVVFIFAGILKNQPVFSLIPVDLTPLSAAGLVATFALRIAAGKVKVSRTGLEVIGISAVLLAFLLLSSLWAPASNQGKMTGTILMWGTFVVGVLLFSTSNASFRRLLNVMLILGLYSATVVLIAATLKTDYAAQTAFFRQAGNYLALGSVLATAMLTSLYRLFRGERLLGFSSALYLLPFAFTALALPLNPGRQTLIGGLFGLILLVAVFRPRLRFGRLKLSYAWIQLGLLAILVAPIVVQQLGTNVNFQALQRLELLVQRDNGANASGQTRELHWYQVQQYWDRQPIIGHGMGAYGIQLSPSGYRDDHPHNIWLELLYEGGLVAVALAGLIVVLLLYNVSFKVLFSPEGVLVTALLALLLMSSSVSGSYGDTRHYMMTLSTLTLPMLAANRRILARPGPVQRVQA